VFFVSVQKSLSFSSAKYPQKRLQFHTDVPPRKVSVEIDSILTKPADWAGQPGGYSTWPPTRNARRPHSIATRLGLEWPPAGDAGSCASVAAAAALSEQIHFQGCPRMRNDFRSYHHQISDHNIHIIQNLTLSLC